MKFDLTDEEWALIEPVLPKRRMHDRVDDRKVINAIFYVLRTGSPWRSLPERYGPYTKAYNRLNRWSRRGIWTRLLDKLPLPMRNNHYLMRRTVIRAAQQPRGEKGTRKFGVSMSVEASATR